MPATPPTPSPPPRAFRDILGLAWPMAIAMLGEVCIGLVDTRLVGGLGASALAGVGIGGSLYYLFFLGALGFMRGVKVLTAHAVGAGDSWRSFDYARVGAGIGLSMGTVGMVALWRPAACLTFLRVQPDIAAMAEQFVAARGVGLPAACALAALIEHRQGLGTVWGVTLAVICGNLVNAFFAWGLIYGTAGLPGLGLPGLPALGAAGAGWGSTISEWAQFLAVAIWGWRSSRSAWRAAPAGTQRRALSATCRELAHIGIPTALHLSCEFLALVAFTSILGRLQPGELAAHQIAIAVARAAFMPGMAIAESACVLVGRALGRCDLRAADQVVRDALWVAMAYMASCGLAFVLLGGPVTRLFTQDTAISASACRLLAMAAAFQLLDAVNLVMRSALRGAKDVRVAAIVGVFLLWACVPTAAWVLGKGAGWGVIGGWCGFAVEASLSAAAFSWRYWRGPWRLRWATA